MHQASILFTFMVLAMGAAYVALTEFGGAEAIGAKPQAEVVAVHVAPVSPALLD